MYLSSLSLFFLFALMSNGVLSTDNNITINATNPSVAPNLNIRVNMSGNGTFKVHVPYNGNEVIASYASQWMQDDGQNRLYISVGDASFGDKSCMGKYWFFDNKHYIVSYVNDNCSNMTCSCVTGYGYYEEVSHYNSTYLAYMGRSYNYKFQREIDTYAGRALDGVGPLTLIMYIGVNDSSYRGLGIIESKNATGHSSSIPFFNEYYYDDVIMTTPNSNYFSVPQICLDYEKAHNCSAYEFDQNGWVIPITNTNSTNTTNTTNNNTTNGNFLSKIQGSLLFMIALIGLSII